MGLGPESVQDNIVWQKVEPKPWEETAVDIKITYCGICGSDIHTLRSGWGPSLYPCCAGHEINGVKVGDRVGVVAQNDSCLGRQGHSEECSAALETYCPKLRGLTYTSKHWMEGTALMLCAGITNYSPLRHYRCGPGKKISIIGVGGLGLYAIMLTKPPEADKFIAISRKADKKGDPLGLVADAYIATDKRSNSVVSSGSLMGGPGESWVQEVPMRLANQAIQDMEAGKARYRYVHIND
ncbi:chaperonin 10-like protein [Aspergillus transmontanensis]|uniref:Chaperonin 10-like protein n=1 Tax=Aspergillus transmontanensis TaxID=1034304 RepID=A0A5N6VVV2_9EURO|nr:chaperonin 10-like protein [Aspergillus transmontanensis]